MAINFTDSPADGATQVISGKTYTYNSAKNKWDTTATEVVGPTAKTYATVNDLPGTALTGDQAFVSGTNRLYIWNGSGWYNIALVNSTPTWTTQPDSSYILASDGTATTITIVATDPEGLPITYSIASDTSGSIATVTQNANVFTITPSTNDVNAGTFSLTFRASDGVNIATAVSSFTLQFIIENSNYTTALITSVGTNNQVNNNFIDSSTNSHTITATGNVTQSTFSPYRHGGYSYYWDGSGTDYFQILSPTAALDFGTGDFTIEMWVWLNDLSSGIILADLRPSETNGNQYIGAFSIGTDGNYQVATGNVQRIVTTGGPITARSWHHIALQRNSGTLEAYVDGSRNATASFTQSLDANRWSLFKNSFAGGGVADAGGGYLKDYRVVKGTAVYSGATYDVPTESLTAISGTSLLLFSNRPTFTYDAADTESITWTNGELAPFSPYKYERYSAADNGGSLTNDGTGTNYLSVTSSDFEFGTSDDFVIEAWVYPTATPSGAAQVVDNRGAANGLNLAFTSSNQFASYSEPLSSQLTGTTKTLNQWYHVAVVRYNGTRKLFVNGVSEASVSDTGDYNSNSLIIASRYSQDQQAWAGNISDLRIIRGTIPSAYQGTSLTIPTTPLTAITNTKLLLSGTNAGIIDKSQSLQTLTLSGDVKSSTTQSKYLTSSMYFDGTGDSISTSDSAELGTGDFTLEAWVYPTTLNSNDTFIAEHWSGTTAGFIFRAHTNNYLSLFDGTTNRASSTAIVTNQWQHVAASRENGTLKLFIDGTQVLSVATSSSLTGPGSGESVTVGAITTSSGFANYFTGYISDARITKGVARYTANFTPPTAALQG
jgi:hypothetical protein